MVRLDVDLSEFKDLGKKFEDAVKKSLAKAGDDLTAMVRGHIVEEANAKLKTRKEMYVQGLSHSKVGDNTWVVSLDGSVRWIEDGREAGSMLPALLASPKAKTARDGSRYVVVPFQHNKGPSKTTTAQADLLSTIKSELKKRDIPYAKIETDQDGKAKLGKLHSFSIMDKPIKTSQGAGQGHGAVGDVKQGPTGIPFLQGINIYQRNVGGKTRRDIVTFRVASSRHADQGRWEHPGLEGVRFFDEAERWAAETWDKVIVPALLADIRSKT